jgi:hypothetical protein
LTEASGQEDGRLTGLPKNHPASVLIAYQQARIAELENRNTP